MNDYIEYFEDWYYSLNVDDKFHVFPRVKMIIIL